MGLDIYAGTLTRYYSHNWKTVVQQWAEENGWGFQKITPDGGAADNEEEMSPAEVQAAVENWRDQILSAISQPGQPPYTPWPEDNEKPYYTDKPDWDAFGAMLLVAACHTYGHPSCIGRGAGVVPVPWGNLVAASGGCLLFSGTSAHR